MTGDLGSPLIRAFVRTERVKRAHGAGSKLWLRAIALRVQLSRDMTDREMRQAWYLVDFERSYPTRKITR